MTGDGGVSIGGCLIVYATGGCWGNTDTEQILDQ
jgi:hypothetical protein